MPATKREPIYRAFTLTDFTRTEYNWEEFKAKVKYLAYGQEICESTGRPHLQGFVYFWKGVRWTTAKDLFYGAKVLPMSGNFRENEAYCSKEGKYTEHGVKPNHNGVKSCLIGYKYKLDGGEKVLEVAEKEEFFPTYLQYRNGLSAYAEHIESKRLKGNHNPVEVYIRYGAAGTGKSRHVYDQYPDVYSMPDTTAQWFGSYNGQSTVLFDDVEVDNVPSLSTFKRITDRYPIEVPIKGGFKWFKPERIYFTSNSHWTTWWKNLSESDMAAIKRRLKSVVYLREDGTEVEEHADREEETPRMDG